MLRIIKFCLIYNICFSIYGQTLDSIKKYEIEFLNSTNDSSRIISLVNWDNIIYISDSDLDLKLNRKIVEICLKNFKNKNLVKNKRKFFKKYYGNSLNNIGLIYFEKSDYINALSLFFKANKIANEIESKYLECNTLNNIGMVYREINSPQKALSYFLKSSKFLDKNIVYGPTYNNIGLCYKELNDVNKAIYYYKLSIKKSLKEDNKLNIANSLCNLGEIYLQQKDYIKAINFIDSSFLMYDEIENKIGYAYSKQLLGKCYLLLNDVKIAEKHLKDAEKISELENFILIKDNVYHNLYKIYKKLNNTEKALSYLEKKEKTLEEIQNLKNKKSLVEMQIDLELNQFKKMNEIKHQKELEISKEKSFRQQIFIFLTLIVLILLTIFFIILRKSYKQLNVKKDIIEKQKIIVEKKQNEILDSISYSKRIQSSILPSENQFKSCFSEFFIFYLPKDIVAGDFYWLEKNNNYVYFAVADCTGHGVPGAMVSVICHNALNRAVKEYNLTDTGKILDKTREIVIQEFEKSNDDVKDGMDISLIAFNYITFNKNQSNECELSINHKNNKIFWSGAHNPLWILRKDEIIEYKADKQPVGKFINSKSFSTNEIEIQKDDTLYFFTDGFQDQFGGDKKKKFKVNQLKELIISIQDYTLKDQKEIIKNRFDIWKGDLEQVDDVCIVGIKI